MRIHIYMVHTGCSIYTGYECHHSDHTPQEGGGGGGEMEGGERKGGERKGGEREGMEGEREGGREEAEVGREGERLWSLEFCTLGI